MKIGPMFIGALLVSGCATTASHGAREIQASDKTEMTAKRCQPLGLVEGSSTQNGVINHQTGKENAKVESLEKASSLGATHIVWHEIDLSFFAIKASGDAYRCAADPGA